MKVMLNTVINFGKYKGNTVEEVIENDPDYLEWAINNIDWFELNVEAEWQLNTALNLDDNDKDYSWHEAYDLLA